MARFLNVCIFVLVSLEVILWLEACYNFSFKNFKDVENIDLVQLPKYSFIVLVNLTIGRAYCTGAIVSRYFVLTAAHCLNKETDTSVSVYRQYMLETKANSSVDNNTLIKEMHSEEIKSVHIFLPWSYSAKWKLFDIGLIQVENGFTAYHLVKAPMMKPCIYPNVRVTCDVVGYVPTEGTSSLQKHILVEQSVTVVKQTEINDENAYINYTGLPYFYQDDKQRTDKNLANSAALLICNEDPTITSNLNGFTIGPLKSFLSENTNGVMDDGLVFMDICPYLSWIRQYVGPSIIRSPGYYGSACFSKTSSLSTKKSHTSWVAVVVFVLLSS